LDYGTNIISTYSLALKAEYRFEDCNGNKTSKNFQGNSDLDGELYGDADIDDGRIEYGLRLKGSGGMVIPHNLELDLVDNLTISLWIKADKIGRSALIVKGGGDGEYRKFGSNAEYSITLWDDGRVKYKHNGSWQE